VVHAGPSLESLSLRVPIMPTSELQGAKKESGKKSPINTQLVAQDKHTGITGAMVEMLSACGSSSRTREPSMPMTMYMSLVQQEYLAPVRQATTPQSRDLSRRQAPCLESKP